MHKGANKKPYIIIKEYSLTNLGDAVNDKFARGIVRKVVLAMRQALVLGVRVFTKQWCYPNKE